MPWSVNCFASQTSQQLLYGRGLLFYLSIFWHLNKWQQLIYGRGLLICLKFKQKSNDVKIYLPVVFFLDQMVSCSKGHQVSVIRRSGNGYWTGAPDISVAQLIRETLKFIRIQMGIVPQDVIVWRPRSALNEREIVSNKNNKLFIVIKYLYALVTAQIEIKLGGMSDTDIDRCTGRYVTTLPTLLLFVSTEQSGVVTLLYHYKRNAWLIICLQFNTSLTDRRQFVLEQLQELSFGYSIPIQDYPMGFVTPSWFVKHYQQFTEIKNKNYNWSENKKLRMLYTSSDAVG